MKEFNASLRVAFLGVGLFCGVATAGTRYLSDVPAWNALGTREEGVRLFKEKVFGVRSVERPKNLAFSFDAPDRVMMDGAALRKLVRISYGGPFGTNSFRAVAFIPKTASAEKPVPAFVLICNRDPGEDIDPERVKKSGFWPAEEIVRRGFAAIAFFNGEIALDRNTGNTDGVFACFEDVTVEYRPKNRWGDISAWAWGASRVMDWIETEPTLDARHVAVVGHSRGGKTALLAGVTDRRFAMACSNDSGCSGAKLNRLDLPKSEHLADICSVFPYWFAPNYIRWVNLDAEMPCDQHQFLALMAPRLVAVASASEDAWAGQRGEYESCVRASGAWEAQGLKGFVSDGFPQPDTAQQAGSVSYHLRAGKHNLTLFDWTRYMDFADRHGWRRGK